MKIKYEMTNGGCTTECPHGIENPLGVSGIGPIHVGSVSCQECRYFVQKSPKEKMVICSFEAGKAKDKVNVRYHIEYSDGETTHELGRTKAFPSFTDGWKYWRKHLDWMFSGSEMRVSSNLHTQVKQELDIKMDGRGIVGTGVIKVV